MKIRKAIITAAGFGSRFLPFVKNIPKEMLPVVDKPSIHYLVEECLEAGIEQIYIVVREYHSLIEDYFYKPADNVKKLLEIQGKMDRYASIEQVLKMKEVEFILQNPDLPYGNGSPVLSAKDQLEPGESFAMLFGDDMVLTKPEDKGALAQLVDFYEQTHCDAVLGAQRVPQKELDRYGIVKPQETDHANGCGVVESIIEKPELDKAPSDLAIFGRQILPYAIFDYLKPEFTGKDGELWLQDANNRLAANAKSMYKIVAGEWMTTGDPVRYLGVQLKYYLAHPKYGSTARELLQQLVL
jgi:UTP--glucose-1-phosphate uridylyltransferase